ncbi:zinc-dependent metalloprotease [Cryobacterium sp. TMT1-3]|uniref:Zinc-dependent metalloprotease n=1 Tax=Cryobacterium luteum TaxID=1424661 RepID=A0A5F0D4W6_9MICO|nr:MULTISPECIES: zinc-dependent metalloprotease [Cryobacterium]TFB89924.1 zinc-dependent metalloprotease [Cryobacterium luteum]TFC25638.1 zinc-dependent metalloprotease [Cryobacterium sp. TMT1-3]
MLRDILSGKSGIDPSQLAGAAGLPNDPASVAALMQQLQGAMNAQGTGVDWQIALTQGQQRAANGQLPATDEQQTQLRQAFHIAALWLDDVITVAELTVEPRLMTRREWVTATMPLWTQLAEPVATSISDSLTRVFAEQVPEEMQGMVANASQLVRSIGGTLFAMQLGQVVGQLASEVVSGGDVGIPLLGEQQAALLPQNVADFGAGLDVPADQVQIYLAVREIAHARLFRHARWLRLHLTSAVTAYARGISIDSSRLEELAGSFDPSNPEDLRQAMVDGSLIQQKSESQISALSRLETMLALVEGWVDVVTARATVRLPKADAIAETVKRRRASGGPAESAFATLVGLELRPRRLREAAAMWQAVTDAVGNEARDALWSHPDLLPTSEDIDDPQRLIARLMSVARGEPEVLDDVDQALEDLLRDDGAERPHEE